MKGDRTARVGSVCRRRWPEMVLGLLACLIFLGSLGSLELWGKREQRAAAEALDTVDNNHWLVAEIQGRPRLEKPPLPRWTAALLLTVTGRREEWIIRLPGALLGPGHRRSDLLAGAQDGRARAGAGLRHDPLHDGTLRLRTAPGGQRWSPGSVHDPGPLRSLASTSRNTMPRRIHQTGEHDDGARGRSRVVDPLTHRARSGVPLQGSDHSSSRRSHDCPSSGESGNGSGGACACWPIPRDWLSFSQQRPPGRFW